MSCVSAVVIGYLDLFRAFLSPFEDDPPFIVDANRVLALEIPLQCFQHVTGWAFQIVQLPCTVEHHEFAAGNLHDISWKSLRYFPLGVHGLGKLATVAPDHQPNVSRYDTFRKNPFEAMQTVDENEAITIAPNEDRRLLSDF
jgi:hypothetical protein